MAQERHDVGFLESYGLVSLRPGWVLLFWVNLGQWFLTADCVTTSGFKTSNFVA